LRTPRRLRRFPSGAIADGGHQWHAERISRHRATAFEVGVHGLGDVLAQVDEPVVALAAHQQRPLFRRAAAGRHVGPHDLDGAQHLQAEQRQ
jgi:hypothetical protein